MLELIKLEEELNENNLNEIEKDKSLVKRLENSFFSIYIY